MAVVALMGAIGTGKTVQAKLLAKELGWQVFMAGQTLRDMKDPEVEKYVLAGKPVPSEMIERLVLKYVGQQPADATIIFDGVPRLRTEMERYDQELPKLGRQIDLAIVLEVHPDEQTRRLKARGRADDTPEGIASRMTWFKEEVEPIIAAYDDRGIVRRVSGNASESEVHEQIMIELREAGLV